MYNWVIQTNIFKNLIRHFDDELKTFKKIYRINYRFDKIFANIIQREK